MNAKFNPNEITARVTGYVNINPDDFLFLQDLHIKNEDFSGKKLECFKSKNCHFEKCKFEKLRIDAIYLGIGNLQSTYTNCSFDGCKLHSIVVGNTRFVNCSFRNVNIKSFYSHNAEFINCVFSGKIKEAVFWGKFLDPDDIPKYKRDYNEFIGNDFSQVDLIGTAFRTGIDLTKQKLPQEENYLCLLDPVPVLNVFEKCFHELPDADTRSWARAILKGKKDDIADGQKQFLFNKKDMKSAIFDLLKKIADEMDE